MSITVRRIQASDLAAMVSLMSEESVFAGLLQTPYPSEAHWRRMLEADENDNHANTVLVGVENGEVLACAGLHATPALLRRRHAAHLSLSVAAPVQGRGIGKTLLAALLDYADNWTPLLRIELTVYADNDHAIALYRRFGFEQEGLLRAYGLRRGQYADAVTMARLHPHPPQWPQPRQT